MEYFDFFFYLVEFKLLYFFSNCLFCLIFFLTFSGSKDWLNINSL